MLVRLQPGEPLHQGLMMNMQCYIDGDIQLFYDAAVPAFAEELLPQGLIGDEL